MFYICIICILFIQPLQTKPYMSFVTDLASLLTIQVPWYVNVWQRSPCLLLGLCNASQLKYAAVAYVRIIDAPTDKCIFLLGAKTKLAPPVKTLTVPRLELNATVLLARRLGHLRHIFAPQLNIIDTHERSDSTIVLSWLTVPHDSFRTYVSNRVHQIHNMLPNCQWYHIESSNNPADCESRGVMPSEVAHFSLYWQGPPIIYTSQWKPSPPPKNMCELSEARPVVYATRADDVPVDFPSDSDDGRVPDLPMYLSKLKLDYAIRIIILDSQRVHFVVLLRKLSHTARVSSRSLSKLSPFIDSDSMISVGGCLKHSMLTYGCKHPTLLAKESHLATLIGERWHRLACHSGPRVMAALILRQYWIVSIRSVLTFCNCIKYYHVVRRVCD